MIPYPIIIFVYKTRDVLAFPEVLCLTPVMRYLTDGKKNLKLVLTLL